MNDPLRKCPRCGSDTCQHDERLLADALASVGTGCINLDLCVSHRWVMSLRRHRRTALVELKQKGEPMGKGQRLALCDLTGRLQSTSGYTFFQRAFVVEREPVGFSVSTFSRADALMPLEFCDSFRGVAELLRDWLTTGTLAQSEAA